MRVRAFGAHRQPASRERTRGFTLIEILIVIALIGMLAAIVIVAINPARQFASARNAQRWSNVNTILNAVYQYAVDNSGTVPTAITTTSTEIWKTGSTGTSTALVDLSPLTQNEKYLTSMPVDPSCPTGCNTTGTGYFIFKSANGRITVNATNTELSSTISATR